MSNIERIAREKHDALVLAQIIVQRLSCNLKDAEALAAPLGLEIWGPDRSYGKGQKIRHGERLPGVPQLYEVVQEITKSQAHQQPGGAGMLAVYRPISPEHTGTRDDPIPHVNGMDCRNGLYYTYADGLYHCKADMIPCVWSPDTVGMWQWEYVGAAHLFC